MTDIFKIICTTLIHTNSGSALKLEPVISRTLLRLSRRVYLLPENARVWSRKLVRIILKQQLPRRKGVIIHCCDQQLYSYDSASSLPNSQLFEEKI